MRSSTIAELDVGAGSFSQSGFLRVIRYSTTSTASCSESRRLGILLSAKCRLGSRTHWNSHALFILLPTALRVGANSSRKRLRDAGLWVARSSWNAESGVSWSLWQPTQPSDLTRISPRTTSAFSPGGAGSAVVSERLQT